MRFPVPTFAFYLRLNPRERVLLLVMGGAVLFIVNLILLSFLLRHTRDLNLQYAEKSQELDREQLFAAQKADLWSPRSAWLQKSQPMLVNRAFASTELLETVKNLAQANMVVVTNQSFPNPPSNTPGNPSGGNADYQPITVKVDTQSDWKSVVRFIAKVQDPAAFLVFEEATLRADPSDPNIMRGVFVVSKWYAPAGK